MSRTFSRRVFLSAAAAMPLASAQVLRRPEGSLSTPQAPQAARVSRAIRSSMLPPGATWKARVTAASDAGFDGLEMVAVESPAEAEEISRAVSEARLLIHSVFCPATIEFPLSSPDNEVVAKSVSALKTALTVASMWRAEEVLVVPAVVEAGGSATEAWTRSQAVLREQILPLAGGFKLHVGLAVPTDRFLVSPAECNRYIDTLRSPWVKASLSVGDAAVAATPQEWIRALSRRLTRLRLNDRHVDRAHGTSAPRNLGDGDVDWQEVRKSLSDAPFLSWVTADLDPGDRAYLLNVRIRVDKFLAGFKPGASPAD